MSREGREVERVAHHPFIVSSLLSGSLRERSEGVGMRSRPRPAATEASRNQSASQSHQARGLRPRRRSRRDQGCSQATGNRRIARS
jgi:hypothetical protein